MTGSKVWLSLLAIAVAAILIFTLFDSPSEVDLSYVQSDRYGGAVIADQSIRQIVVFYTGDPTLSGVSVQGNKVSLRFLNSLNDRSFAVSSHPNTIVVISPNKAKFVSAIEEIEYRLLLSRLSSSSDLLDTLRESPELADQEKLQNWLKGVQRPKSLIE